uniref:Protein SRG1 n=1 Tax=Anthurium amnicola TaxID=1678845 RepID=A0A1D1YZW3_9ARAE
MGGRRGPPLRCAQREAHRQPISRLSSHHLSASIPVVDLRRLSQSDGSNEEEMAKLRSALASWGLFQATGHGIPASFLDQVRRIGRRFFELPTEEKRRCSSNGGVVAEGYGDDRADRGAQLVDWNGRILLKVEPEDQRKLEFWPDNPSSFRETVHEYAARVKMVVQLILRAMAKSLDLEETQFLGQFWEGMDIYSRFSHYPCCPRPELVLGLKPHADNSVVTVILQGGDAEGLEILKDNLWVRVPNNPEVLLVQMGDIMEIMSNGAFKSSVHRVVTHSEKERFSTSLFHQPGLEKLIGPAEGLLGDGKPRLYRDFKFKDYIEVHLKGYLEGKRTIDWAKL